MKGKPSPKWYIDSISNWIELLVSLQEDGEIYSYFLFLFLLNALFTWRSLTLTVYQWVTSEFLKKFFWNRELEFVSK